MTTFRWRPEARAGHARAGWLDTAHGSVPTPTFMPVGTVGTVKAMTMDSVRSTGAGIVLGNTYHLMLRPGAERVRALGGLLVLGAERQRSRRVDDQLAGRAGRQGDPGESVFFVSPEDDLLRLYGQDCRRLTPKAVRRAQREAESFDAEQRKNVLETDNVLQAYRRQFLRERDRLLTCGDICALLREMAAAETARLLRMYDDPSNRYANFRIAFCRVFGRDALPECTDIPDVAAYAAGAEAILREKAAEDPGVFSELARAVLLQCADEAWTAFLEEFEQLKQGYRLMSVGKSDSRQVLIRNAAELLDRAGASVREEGLRRVFLCRLSRQTES